MAVGTFTIQLLVQTEFGLYGEPRFASDFNLNPQFICGFECHLS